MANYPKKTTKTAMAPRPKKKPTPKKTKKPTVVKKPKNKTVKV